MSEPMKTQPTKEYAELTFRVPAAHAGAIQKIVSEVLSLLPDVEEDEGRLYTVDEVFPEGISPADVLRGARFREEMTQAQLAAKVGVKVSNISEMERGKRPIGKEMAKRLAKALNISHKVFL